jgi:hypothetical protein
MARGLLHQRAHRDRDGARRPALLPETERRSGDFDVAGALASTLGMTALVSGLVRAADAGWGDGLTVATLAAGVLLLAAFDVNEQRATQPIMPLRLVASAERSGAYAGRILFLGAMLGFWFFKTQYLQSVKGYSPLEAGVAFLPMTVVNFAVAVAVPKLTRQDGNALLLAGGLTVTLIGMAWLNRLSADTPYLTGIALPMILIGAGQGATLSPLTAAGIAGVAPEDAGALPAWSMSAPARRLARSRHPRHCLRGRRLGRARRPRPARAPRGDHAHRRHGHARARPRRRADRPAAPGRRDGKVSNEVIHRVLRELDLEESRLDL